MSDPTFSTYHMLAKLMILIGARALTFVPMFCDQDIVLSPSKLHDPLHYLMVKRITVFGIAWVHMVMEKRWDESLVAHSINV